MKFSVRPLTMLVVLSSIVSAQTIDVRVDITHNGPDGGVAITPAWVGFHSGSFDSYNGGLAAQPGLESIAEDGSTALVSSQFLDFDATDGGYSYVGPGPSNALVRTGDLQDQYRVDATIGCILHFARLSKSRKVCYQELTNGGGVLLEDG